MSDASSGADSRTSDGVAAAIAAHDRAALGSTPVWLGAEPTFTDRFSESREWLCEALGEDKEKRARQLLTRLLQHHPGAAVLRPLGRPYAGEPRPRWCYGLYAQRSGEGVWSGPADLFADGAAAAASVQLLPRLRSALIEAIRDANWFAAAVPGLDGAQLRLVCRCDGLAAPAHPKVDVRLGRPSIHAGAHETAPVDQLASDGVLLVVLHAGAGAPDANDVWVELPAFPSVPTFVAFLRLLGRAARAAGVEALGLRGFPPPVDESVAWTTLTPDPAVLEVNLAPEATLSAFLRSTRFLFEQTAQEGLFPYRLHYNGAVSDSGGEGS